MKATSFGYKNAWLAVKSSDSERVARALGLADTSPADWTTGVAVAYEWPGTVVFVSPPVDGWTLCVGTALFPYADRRPPQFGDLAVRLSSTLKTEVQFFATHRVVEAHAWARATPQGLARAYLYVGESGETVLNLGAPAAEEQALGFAFFDERSPEAETEGYWERHDLCYPREEHVMKLAGKWSVDPSALEERNLEVGSGLVGRFPESQPEHPADAGPARAQTRPWWKLW